MILIWVISVLIGSCFCTLHPSTDVGALDWVMGKSLEGKLSGTCAPFPMFETTEPDSVITSIKQLMKFEDEHIYERWWMTEELTCQEVKNVLEVMKENIETDLSLLVQDTRKFLNNTLLSSRPNRRKQRCIEYINDQIQEAITQGIDLFSRCTATSFIIQDQIVADLQEKRKTYKKIVEYILENLDVCLDYNNKRSEVHRTQCIQEFINDYNKQVNEACAAGRQSQCMTHFRNDILNCSAKVYYDFVEKISDIMKDNSCVHHDSSNPVQTNFGIMANDVLYKYENMNLQLEEIVDSTMKKSIMHFTNLQLCQERISNFNYQLEFTHDLSQYFNTLNQSYEENWSSNERSCTSKAVNSLKTKIVKATKDQVECKNNSVQQREVGLNKFTNISKEFNEKFQKSGNVALLKCIAHRPQEIFNSMTMENCALLAKRNIEWEWHKTCIEVESVHSTVVPLEILPNGKICGSLLSTKLYLDADGILETCERCMYGYTGEPYAVTLRSLYEYKEFTTRSYEDTTHYSRGVSTTTDTTGVAIVPIGPWSNDDDVPEYGHKRTEPKIWVPVHNN